MFNATKRAIGDIKHSIPRLKVKLGGKEYDSNLEIARLQAVREAAPTAELLVDVNEGWNDSILEAMLPVLSETQVLLLEQPLPADRDSVLLTLRVPCPVFADESSHDIKSLPALKGKYQGINIKLDKAGGLAAALELRQRAMAAKLQIMVGCMVGSSLCIAPAVLLAQGENVIADLDGAALLAQDEQPALKYDGGLLHPPLPELWG